MHKLKLVCGVLTLSLIFAPPSYSATGISINYQLTSSVLSAAGGGSVSNNYSHTSTVGQSSPIGISTSLHYVEKSGYLPTTAKNHSPIANAGPDQHVSLNDVVTLNAAKSYDPDGDLLTYHWTLTKPDGEDGTSELSDVNLYNPTLTIVLSGTYTATLAVSDGSFTSFNDTVLISTDNVPPVANAGPDQAVVIGNEVMLNGGASSDAESAPLTYQWTLTKPDGSNGTADLSDATIVNPVFTVNATGAYLATLVVNDGALNSEENSAIISTENLVPVAKIVYDFPVYVGAEVALDASNSFDPNGTPLSSYLWSFVLRPSGSTALVTNADQVNAAFIIDMAGTYIVSLTVNDGQLSSYPEIAVISSTPQNQSVEDLLNEAIHLLQGLDSAKLMSRNSADTLINKIEVTIKKLLKSDYNGVAYPLRNDILPKIDGCTLRGQADTTGANERDWILDCDAQNELYHLIFEAISILVQIQ